MTATDTPPGTPAPAPGAGASPLEGRLSRRQVQFVFAGLMTGLLLSALDGNIMSTAIPTIVGELGGLEHVAWVGTAYLLTSTASTPLYGKLSDLYGRRLLYQVGITLFVLGSVVCALADSMGVLVGGRALQGLGSGGLQSLGFIVIGDLVPPRERGRYVGLFTAVYAFSSVAGPLLGGFLVDSVSWRWIFWVNLPLGLLAFVVVTASLKIPFVKRRPSIDYVGAALMVAAVSALVLFTTWGGNEYSWTSAVIVGLGTAAVVLGTAFVVWERRVPEPIIPMRLFGNQVFSLVVVISLALGTTMFGATYFLPLYLQVVTGASATNSGLLLVPLMAGITISSVAVGRLTARTGRYKRYPVTGLLVSLVGMAMLTQLGVDTARAYTSVAMFIVGFGLGATMPTVSLAAQNAVDFRDLGAATSAVTFFRSLGGAVGLAFYGALFTSRLTSELASRLPGTDPAQLEGLLRSPEAIRALEEPLRSGVLESVAAAVAALFLFAVPITLGAWLASLFMKELPLRERSALDEARAAQGPTAGAPSPTGGAPAAG